LVEEVRKMSATQRTGIGIGVVVCIMLALVVGWMLGGARPAAPTPAWAADVGAARYGEEGIRVSGTAVVRARPELATVRLGYESRNRRARQAKLDNDAVMKKVLAAMAKHGVDRKDIQTVQYRLFPVWEPWPTPSSTKALFWHVLHMVEVRVHKVDTVADVIDAASAAGADKVDDVEFSVESLHALRAQARELAVKVAREKAEQLAKLTGAHAGRLVSVSDYNPQYDYYWGRRGMTVNAQMSVEAPDSVSVSPDSVVSSGQIVVQAREELVFAVEP
jgi:uncharacterized protein YggE